MVNRATQELYQLVADVLTENQLDFQPADGRPTIRQRLSAIREGLHIAPQPIERVMIISPTDTTYPITVVPPREGSEFDTLALWGSEENLISVDRPQAAQLRDVFDRWLGH